MGAIYLYKSSAVVNDFLTKRQLYYSFIISKILVYIFNSEHRKMRAKQQHGDESIYDQYQPEMDSKFRHRMDNRSEVQEITF